MVLKYLLVGIFFGIQFNLGAMCCCGKSSIDAVSPASVASTAATTPVLIRVRSRQVLPAQDPKFLPVAPDAPQLPGRIPFKLASQSVQAAGFLAHLEQAGEL